jgi:predicted 2-oxoglutarate/Fe(II)-dependent dioxygenase YbiX
MSNNNGSSKNIVILENFISQNDLEIIKNNIDINIEWTSYSQAGIPDKSSKNLETTNKTLYSILKKYIDKTQKEIEFFFGRPLEEGFPGLREWNVGEFQPLHADGEDTEGNPNEAYIVDYGSVLYLTDEYDGGEIYFPEHNIDIKPNAGTLIFFPSNNFYNHGVKEITFGKRYTSAQFWIPTKYKILREQIKKSRSNY